MRRSSWNTSPIAALQASSFFGTVIWSAFASNPINQHRSQLSAAYWTTLRNGGDVTTSETELEAICGAEFAGPVIKSALDTFSAKVFRTADETSPSSWRVFLRISFATSRFGGVWPRRSLILRCDFTDTAWFGGKE